MSARKDLGTGRPRRSAVANPPPPPEAYRRRLPRRRAQPPAASKPEDPHETLAEEAVEPDAQPAPSQRRPIQRTPRRPTHHRLVAPRPTRRVHPLAVSDPRPPRVRPPGPGLRTH